MTIKKMLAVSLCLSIIFCSTLPILANNHKALNSKITLLARSAGGGGSSSGGGGGGGGSSSGGSSGGGGGSSSGGSSGGGGGSSSGSASGGGGGSSSRSAAGGGCGSSSDSYNASSVSRGGASGGGSGSDSDSSSHHSIYDSNGNLVATYELGPEGSWMSGDGSYGGGAVQTYQASNGGGSGSSYSVGGASGGGNGGTWVQNPSTNKWYFYENTNSPSESKASTGWKEISGSWYYFGSDGSMYQNAMTPDGYYVDSNGAWVKQ